MSDNVKAQALREAAAEFSRTAPNWSYGHEAAANWLNARADELERGRAAVHNPGTHTPHNDDGVTYCGWSTEHGTWHGCGELWPCAAVRADEVKRA